MRYKLVGYKVSKGEFVDTETGAVIGYDNVNLHCIGQSFDDKHVGEEVSCIKIKSKFVDIEKLDFYIGEEIDVEFVPRGGKCVPCAVYLAE